MKETEKIEIMHFDQEGYLEDGKALYEAFYEREGVVRICRSGNFPNLAAVRGSNYCDIGVTGDERTGRVIVVSVIDNLVKGAAGQAVQSMNLMCGFEEGAGLETVIAVHKRNIAALGHLQRRVASGPWPGILLIDNNNSPVPGSILPAKRQAVILAAVIDQDDFHVLDVLIEYTLQR